jgi:hypothetical protein
VSPIRVSRCTQPQDPPLIWLNHYDENNTDVIAQEMAAALKAIPLPASELKARYAEITQRLAAASRGELIEGDGLKPIVLDPELWELRWQFGRELYRQYHAEPANMPAWLLALRFHRKVVNLEDEGETLSLQNEEINIAQRRRLHLRETS